jgi:hypothetical protein
VSVLWIVDTLTPKARKDLLLKIRVRDSSLLRTAIEALLRRNKVQYELRALSAENVTYFVRLPFFKKTDALTSALLNLGGKEMAVEWSDKRPRNEA